MVEYFTMYSCVCAQTHTDRHSNTRKCRYKESNPPTCTDLFTFTFLDHVTYFLFQYVADFLQWCVDKFTSPNLASRTLPDSIQPLMFTLSCFRSPCSNILNSALLPHPPILQRSRCTPKRSSKVPLRHVSKSLQQVIASKALM